MQHNRIIGDAKGAMMAVAGGVPARSATDKSQVPLQPPQPQQPLKCPRCDSSNTKFCYYNNYSLSQPRHFCKACKRYWTRGGTLRNVPVGGGCRKNKRVRRTSAASSPSSPSSGPGAAADAPLLPNPILRAGGAGSGPLISPYLYNVQAGNHVNLNPYNLYDLHPQGSSALGVLGLHQGSLMGDVIGATSSVNSLLSSYSLLGSSPPLASLAASNSSLHQQRFLSQGLKEASDDGDNRSHFPSFGSFEGLQMAGRGTDSEIETKGLMKVEWNINGTSTAGNINDDQMVQIGEASPGIYWNNASAVGANWSDFGSNNMGSSVTSLI